MANGFIGFSQPGDLHQPSPSIWGDCPNTLLNDRGFGYFINQDFLGNYQVPAATTSSPGIENFAGAGTSVFGNAASATFGPNALQIATGGTDNNNEAIFGEELGTIVRGSGLEFWYETCYAPNALGDSAFFLGLTTRAGINTATTGLLSANPSNSAAATTVAVSTAGFISVQAASAIATVNAVYSKGAAAAVTVATNVTNSSAILAAQTALGLMDTRANLVAQKYRKYGLRFDGDQKLYFYVDGYKVATQTVDSTFDQTALWVPVVAIKTGTGSAVTGIVDFIRAGYRSRF